MGTATNASNVSKGATTAVKSIIVTGCAGLLGSHFTRHLLAEGYRVVGIDDLSGGYSDYLPKETGRTPELTTKFEFCPFNLVTSHKALDKVFQQEKAAACFHLAAYAAEGLSPFIRLYNYTNNVVASANVINACINSDTKLIFTSSMAVYGDQPAPFDEEMVPRPIDPYGIAKYAVEMDIDVASCQHGLRYNVVRPHNVVGIYQNIWDKYRNVVGIFIRRALDNESILIYGDGLQTRAFSDIQYYMEPFEKLIYGHDREVYNIGADQSFTINHLADRVCYEAKKYGISTTVTHKESRHEVKEAYCNHQKAKDQLDFKDETDLEDLVSKMFVWALDQPHRKQKVMQYEVEKGIYDYWK